jgi:hypothetical protein
MSLPSTLAQFLARCVIQQDLKVVKHLKAEAAAAAAAAVMSSVEGTRNSLWCKHSIDFILLTFHQQHANMCARVYGIVRLRVGEQL